MKMNNQLKTVYKYIHDYERKGINILELPESHPIIQKMHEDMGIRKYYQPDGVVAKRKEKRMRDVKELHDKGYTSAMIAEKLGLSISPVQNTLRFLKLTPHKAERFTLYSVENKKRVYFRSRLEAAKYYQLLKTDVTTLRAGKSKTINEIKFVALKEVITDFDLKSGDRYVVDGEKRVRE